MNSHLAASRLIKVLAHLKYTDYAILGTRAPSPARGMPARVSTHETKDRRFQAFRAARSGAGEGARAPSQTGPRIRECASNHQKPNFIFRALICLVLVLAATGASVISAQAQPALSQPMIMQWRYQSDRTLNLTPASDGKIIYLPLAEGVLVALNPADGKLIWKAETGGDFSAAPAVDDRSVFVATQYADADRAHVRGTLRAISKAT